MFSDTGQLEYSDQAGGGGAPDNKCYTDTDTTSHQQSFWRNILEDW